MAIGAPQTVACSCHHIVGRHGGAWIYSVDSHEELDRLLAQATVYNFASYEIYPPVEMNGEPTLAPPRDIGGPGSATGN